MLCYRPSHSNRGPAELTQSPERSVVRSSASKASSSCTSRLNLVVGCNINSFREAKNACRCCRASTAGTRIYSLQIPSRAWSVPHLSKLKSYHTCSDQIASLCLWQRTSPPALLFVLSSTIVLIRLCILKSRRRSASPGRASGSAFLETY